VVPVTGNFQSETALNPLAREAMLAAIESGWADPKKIGQHASKAAILRNGAIESIAHSLGLAPDQIEITGEVGLSYYLALAGFFTDQKNLYFGAGDRSGVIATVRSHVGAKIEIPLMKTGKADFQSTPIGRNSVLAFQLGNGETGVVSVLPTDLPDDLLIAVDATATGSRVNLPNQWGSACFDSRAWEGPSGLAVVAIAATSHWNNPLPHISSVRRTYGTFSLPLLLASAVALENFQADETRIRNLTKALRSEVIAAIPDVIIAGALDESMPHLTSFVFSGVNGEEVLRELDRKGFSVDSGSACTAMNLQPSHVLSAMGLATDGNVRITIHTNTAEPELKELARALVSAVQSQQQR
jgi:cysteine desulfurase